MNSQQAAPGWYPVDGGQRYWDGAAWTEQFQPFSAPGPSSSTVRRAASRFTSNEMEVPEGTIWSAVGKGVGGMTTGRYRMDAEYLHFEKGTLRTAAQQVHMGDVYNVDVKQSMTQKARGVYTVTVHRHGGPPVLLEDVPDGPGVQRTVTDTFRKAYLTRQHRQIQIDGARHQATNTTRQEIAYGGMPPGGFAPSAPAPGMPMGVVPAAGLPPVAQPSALAPAHNSAEVIDAEVVASPDPIAQLKELGALRDAGILTEDEFSAKKADILSRI
ncbi:MAG: hypothetical protein JWN84_2232 [Nocardioides sp.]|jgi:hypothetical protein|nr:hypothetical protein [Nocardioides sp.]